MKLRFSLRMTLLNVLITVFITALVGFMVVQGLLSLYISDAVDTLSSTSDEAGVMISLSLSAIQSEKPRDVLFKENANFYAEQIAANYSLSAIIYDSSLNIIGAKAQSEDYSAYSDKANEVLKEGKKAYVYTTTEGINNVVLYSPINLSGEPAGVLVLITTMAKAEDIIAYVVKMFIIAGIVGTVASSGLYLISHNASTKPLRLLAQYFSESAKDPGVPFPDITYTANDSVGTFVTAFTDMQNRINDKIADLDYERDNFATIIASLQDGILVVNSKGEIVSTNRRAEEFFKNESDYRRVIPDFEDMMAQTLASEEGVSTEIEYESRFFYVRAVPVQRRAEQNGVLFVISDITAEKNAEADQNRFISSVSHELRTPLTTIIGYVDMMKRRGTDDKQLTQKSLDTLSSEAQRLLRLVNDLLSMGKLNSYEFELIFTSIDLNELIEQVVTQMNLLGKSKNIAVLYESTELPIINGDRDRLKQCLLNVIDNAVKYSHPEEVVRVTAIAHEKFVEITVRDYGDGVPDAKWQKVFDAFYRVEDDRTRKTEIGGYGLGLSVVKNIISRHNGTVNLSSVAGSGTLVTIRLPYQSEEETENEKED